MLDVNDNRPVFNPRDYNATIRSDAPPSDTIIKVIATDLDAGSFGQVTYRISGGNDAGVFRIDRVTGELQVARPSLIGRSPVHLLNVTASDTAGLNSLVDARVRVSVAMGQRLPICERPRYAISARENVLQNSIIGDVKEAIVGDVTAAGATGELFLMTRFNVF